MAKNQPLTAEDISILLEVFPQGLIAFDLETTGLSPFRDKIVEFGAIKLNANGEVLFFEKLVNPQMPIPPESTKIHGIDDVHVASASTIEKVLPTFIDFIEELPLIAHNAKFDIGFIVFCLHRQKKEFPSNPVYCSLNLARKAFKRSTANSLYSLAHTLNIPLGNHHRAKDDALTCLRITRSAIKTLENRAKEALKKSFHCAIDDYAQNNQPEKIPKHLTGLLPSVEKREKIAIKYAGGNKKRRNIFRPIRPQSILPMPRGNVLYAHCLLSDLYKFFFLHKIKDFREIRKDDSIAYT